MILSKKWKAAAQPILLQSNEQRVMRFKKKEKIILALGTLGLLSLAAWAGAYFSKKFEPDVVVKPNITEIYQEELETELSRKKQDLAENPGQTDTILDIGALEQKLGRLSAAEQAFKQALKINSLDYLAYTRLGILYDEMGRFADADNMLRVATQLQPADERPFQALINLYKMHFPGKADELNNIFRAGSDYSKSPAIWAEYAQFLEDRRDYRQAWLYWQEVLSAEPENAKAAAAVARLREQLRIKE